MPAAEEINLFFNLACKHELGISHQREEERSGVRWAAMTELRLRTDEVRQVRSIGGGWGLLQKEVRQLQYSSGADGIHCELMSPSGTKNLKYLLCLKGKKCYYPCSKCETGI